MSLEELSCMKRVDDIVKLYLTETTNDYLLESINYGRITISNGKYYYNDCIVRLKEKYSPIKMTISMTQIYNWISWRNSEFLVKRYNYLEKHYQYVGHSATSFSNRYFNCDDNIKLSKTITKRIAKLCKGCN